MIDQRDEKTPDFLRMEGATTDAEATGPSADGGQAGWKGWPTKKVEPLHLFDDKGRVRRIRTPVMDLEGPLTPTEFFYVVQHFDVPEPIPAATWTLTVDGEVHRPLRLSLEELQRFPGRTVRTVMECSGSDADFFEFFKGEGPRPSRTKDRMILSGGEFTGTPLAAVLREAGLSFRAVSVRAEGPDLGLPATAAPGTEPFYYDKALPVGKALHPDTLLAWAHNGQVLEHLHGAPVRLLVPGWSGNWSVKWLRRLEVLDHPGNCWYHWNFYYYGESPDDPNRELITAIPVKSLVTYPRDDGAPLRPGVHVVRGLAWSGEAAIARVEVSVDGGASWHPARVEESHDRWLWVRWSYVWDARQPGNYTVMSRATDHAGREQSHTPRYNRMRKNFSAIVGYDVTVE